MSNAADRRFMALALSLGRRGLGRVWPNPAVGCVIVQDGVIVGRARTGDGGRPHAETQALAQAAEAARGATAYVTLEPCAHHGQTGPCAEALVRAGIARCVIATGDPDPRVSGRGIAILQAAGIAVETGVAESEARADHAGFLQSRMLGRPWLTLKLATTLDGRIATATGDSQWITGPLARHAVHGLRLQHDAVMVGGGTARADDPMLNVRGFGAVRQPVRIVVSRDLSVPLSGKLARSAGDQPLWLCHGPGADAAPWVERGAVSIACDLAGAGVDPAAVMAALARRGLTRVFCEGGGSLAASLLAAGLVDEILLFQGGTVTGADGLPALGPMGLTELARAPRFALTDLRRIGTCVLQRWQPQRQSEA